MSWKCVKYNHNIDKNAAGDDVIYLSSIFLGFFFHSTTRLFLGWAWLWRVGERVELIDAMVRMNLEMRGEENIEGLVWKRNDSIGNALDVSLWHKWVLL